MKQVILLILFFSYGVWSQDTSHGEHGQPEADNLLNCVGLNILSGLSIPSETESLASRLNCYYQEPGGSIYKPKGTRQEFCHCINLLTDSDLNKNREDFEKAMKDKVGSMFMSMIHKTFFDGLMIKEQVGFDKDIHSAIASGNNPLENCSMEKITSISCVKEVVSDQQLDNLSEDISIYMRGHPEDQKCPSSRDVLFSRPLFNSKVLLKKVLHNLKLSSPLISEVDGSGLNFPIKEGESAIDSLKGYYDSIKDYRWSNLSRLEKSKKRRQVDNLGALFEDDLNKPLIQALLGTPENLEKTLNAIQDKNFDSVDDVNNFLEDISGREAGKIDFTAQQNNQCQQMLIEIENGCKMLDDFKVSGDKKSNPGSKTKKISHPLDGSEVGFEFMHKFGPHLIESGGAQESNDNVNTINYHQDYCAGNTSKTGPSGTVEVNNESTEYLTRVKDILGSDNYIPYEELVAKNLGPTKSRPRKPPFERPGLLADVRNDSTDTHGTNEMCKALSNLPTADPAIAKFGPEQYLSVYNSSPCVEKDEQNQMIRISDPAHWCNNYLLPIVQDIQNRQKNAAAIAASTPPTSSSQEISGQPTNQGPSIGQTQGHSQVADNNYFLDQLIRNPATKPATTVADDNHQQDPAQNSTTSGNRNNRPAKISKSNIPPKNAPAQSTNNSTGENPKKSFSKNSKSSSKKKYSVPKTQTAQASLGGVAGNSGTGIASLGQKSSRKIINSGLRPNNSTSSAAVAIPSTRFRRPGTPVPASSGGRPSTDYSDGANAEGLYNDNTPLGARSQGAKTSLTKVSSGYQKANYGPSDGREITPDKFTRAPRAVKTAQGPSFEKTAGLLGGHKGIGYQNEDATSDTIIIPGAAVVGSKKVDSGAVSGGAGNTLDANQPAVEKDNIDVAPAYILGDSIKNDQYKMAAAAAIERMVSDNKGRILNPQVLVLNVEGEENKTHQVYIKFSPEQVNLDGIVLKTMKNHLLPYKVVDFILEQLFGSTAFARNSGAKKNLLTATPLLPNKLLLKQGKTIPANYPEVDKKGYLASYRYLKTLKDQEGAVLSNGFEVPVFIDIPDMIPEEVLAL